MIVSFCGALRWIYDLKNFISSLSCSAISVRLSAEQASVVTVAESSCIDAPVSSEDAAFSSPLNTALALRQTLTDGIFGFRVNQNRIRKLLNTLKEKDSTYINMVNDIYASQISGTDFYTDLYTKRFVPKELKDLASSVFDDTESSNSSSTDEN